MTTKEGKYPPYKAWGHSSIVNPWGEVIATCDENANVVSGEILLEKVREMRRNIPTSLQKRTDLYEIRER